MSERIDDVLDGRLPREALNGAEQADADVVRRAADEMRTFLGARPAPDLTAGVLRRIERLGPAPRQGRVARVIGSIWHPVQISIRPAYALAGAAGVVALLLYGTPERRPAAVSAGEPAPLFVQFRLEAEASRVQLAGSFTNWEGRYELRQTGPGLWSVTLPLTEGVHDYAFLLDGERWVADPYAAQVSDGFGGRNSRLTLLLPAGASRS
jgi:hypothetical protein